MPLLAVRFWEELKSDMGEWFEDWFESDEYLTVYSKRNDEEAGKMVSLILNNISLPAGASVLDLACGAGRHSILFAAKGFKVTAVDLSSKLLTLAIARAKELKLEMDFFKEDLRKFTNDKQFNLVLNLFTSFGYFDSDEENLKLLSLAYNQLAPGGYFVFDYLNKVNLERTIVHNSTNHFNDIKIEQNRKIENKRIVKDIVFKYPDGNTKHFKESVRLYNPDYLLFKFKELGFTVEKVFGSYEGKSFDFNNSQRLILVCKK